MKRARRSLATIVAAASVVVPTTTLASVAHVVTTAAPAAAASGDSLAPGQRLGAGQSLVSRNGQYRLVMQSDGNLVQYGPGNGVRWSSGTWGSPGASVQFQGDGNVVLVDKAGRPRWSTGTWGGRAARTFVMQEDGNQVAYSPASPVWWSGTTFAPPPPPPVNPAEIHVALVNQTRAAHGVHPLAWEPRVVAKVDGWSVHMANLGYLVHSNLAQGVPDDWRYLGENVSYGPSPQAAFDAFVASPAHLANMLNPRFTRFAVGLHQRNGTWWATHVFIG